MQLIVTLDSIYQDSICKINASSSKNFSLSVDSSILTCNKGEHNKPQTIYSAEDKGKHGIEVSLQGNFNEVKTQANLTGSAAQYGMSFYPFVSSEFKLSLDCAQGLSHIIFEIPSQYRIIWMTAQALSPAKKQAHLKTSYSEKNSTYVFSWPEDQPEGSYEVKFNIRTGGPQLLRQAYFPIYYYIIALIAIAAAATAEHTNVLLGALAASWVFLLKHINSCDIPRRNVLIFQATIAMGCYLFIWGLTWKLQKYFYNEWIITLEGFIALVSIINILKAFRIFEAHGTLPSWITSTWGHMIVLAEKKQHLSN